MAFWNKEQENVNNAMSGKIVDPDDFFSNMGKKSAPVDPDDFFKDMGTKKAEPAKPAPVPKRDPEEYFAEAKAQAEAKAFHEAVAEVDVPVVTGLREAPEETAPSTLSGLDISTLSTDGLTDKAALDDGMYHGTMEDA